jgi:hypothetical protein
MNLEAVQGLVNQRARVSPVALSTNEVIRFEPVLGNHDIRQYIEHCLPVSSYVASNVSVLTLEAIHGFTAEGCSPGGFILPFGYLVIATSIGGNAICFGSQTGGVYWADHVTFTSTITYRDRATRRWEEWGEYTPGKVERALVRIADDIECFLKALLNDQLTGQLRALE